jgi:hypothetical protein
VTDLKLKDIFNKARGSKWAVGGGVAAVLFLVGAVGFAMSHTHWLGLADSGPEGFARIPPAEFLYLDDTRILGYEAQLAGGEAGALRRISKQIQSENGEAKVSGFSVGASSQTENEVESTLTPAATSEMAVMLNDLRGDSRPGVAVHDVDITEPSSLSRVREGWLVSFHTRDLLSPGYIRPYVVVRQSATLAALFPRISGNAASKRRSEVQRAKAKTFVRQIGPNPRITFSVAPPTTSASGDHSVRVLLPMQYADLTSERSMLEKGTGHFTGGRLTVVGKVIRIFPGDEGVTGGVSACSANSCRNLESPVYTDFATRETWKAPLEHASNNLVDHVSHNCKAPWLPGEANPLHKTQIQGRHCFLARLKRQTRLPAPGVVVLPLAVYK